MKIVGTASLEALYPDGTRVPIASEELNHICFPVWRRFFIKGNNEPSTSRLPVARNAAAQNYASGIRWYMYYGSRDVYPTALNAFYREDAWVYTDQDTPYWTDRATVNDPDVMTFTAVIPAPTGGPRTIRVLGLSINTDNQSFVEDVPAAKLTILKLTNPCIQAVNVSVIVTYRLYIHPATPVADVNISDTWWDRMRALLKISATPAGDIYREYNNLNAYIVSSCYDYGDIPKYAVVSGVYSGDSASELYELTDNGLYKYTYTSNYYSNVLRHQFSFDATSAPAMGTWVKRLAIASVDTFNVTGTNTITTGLLHQLAVPASSSPVQNVFPQRNNPPGPFQDLTVNNTATMTGTITFDPTAWTDPKLQQVTRISVMSTGAVGVATYRIAVMNFLAGFVGNRWVPRTAYLPQAHSATYEFKLNDNAAFYETKITQGGTTYRSPDGDRLVVAGDCSRTRNGISVYNVITGAKYNFNASNGLPVTAVADVAVSNGYIYVACANTGLWRIYPDLLTVEAIPSPTGDVGAYQISAKRNANTSLWVVHNGGLCHLTNPADALGALVWTVHNATSGTPTFTFAGISDNNWSTVTSFEVDPDHVNNRMLLITTSNFGDTSNFNRKGFVWWDDVSGVAANPSTGGADIDMPTWNLANLLNHSDNLRCIGGRWAISRCKETSSDDQVYHFTYGAGNLSATYINTTSNQRLVPATINGIDGWIGSKVYITYGYNTTGCWIKNSTLGTIPNATTINSASPYVDFNLREGVSTYISNMATQAMLSGSLGRCLIYLPGSNMFLTHEYPVQAYGVTPFILQPNLPSVGIYDQYKDAFWRDYGWDGAQWVLNHGGNRTIHGTVEVTPPLNGLGVSFTDGVSGTSFVAGEYWTTCVGKGLMKDNGTTYAVSSFSWSLDATEPFTQTEAIPQSPLGALVDEWVTFRPIDANTTIGSNDVSQMSVRCIQHKGTVVSRSNDTGTTGVVISDQIIPANTEFDLQYVWITIECDPGWAGYNSTMGVATGTLAFTNSLHFRALINNQLALYNNSTLLATIANAEPGKVCRIVRNASNSMQAYYDGVAVGAPVISNSAMVVLGNSNYQYSFAGWAEVKLTYTEARRVLRLGSSGASTGCFSPSFTGLSVTGQVKDTVVTIGTGTPLTAVLDYTVGSNPLTDVGNVKVAPGAGWLIFHDAEAANTVNVSTILHHLYNPA